MWHGSGFFFSKNSLKESPGEREEENWIWKCGGGSSSAVVAVTTAARSSRTHYLSFFQEN